MAVLAFLVLLLAMTGYSSASYCVCKDGVSEKLLQVNIDYACGAGVDCSAISSNGACYQPNTVKAHCDYAVNSYYQKEGQANGSCDFKGTATVSDTLTSTVASGCNYPSSPSQVSASTPTSTPLTTTTGGTTALGPSPSINAGFSLVQQLNLGSLPILLLSSLLLVLLSRDVFGTSNLYR